MKENEKDNKRDAAEAESPDQELINSEDYQFILRHLINAYRPVLEEELQRANHPDQLEKEAESQPPKCDDEIALADRIFKGFLTDEVVVRLLPKAGRETLGPLDRWRWCRWP